jgi:hypothetical protein
MKLLMAIAFLLALFFANAFRSNKLLPTVSVIPISERNIISCGPVNAGYTAAFTSYRFTAGSDLMEKIFTNNNRKPAGELRNGILYLKLETRTGNWFPETEE